MYFIETPKIKQSIFGTGQRLSLYIHRMINLSNAFMYMH